MGSPYQARFVPSAAFTGAAEGYVFKMGPKGLGYYQDIMPGTCAFRLTRLYACVLEESSSILLHLGGVSDAALWITPM